MIKVFDVSKDGSTFVEKIVASNRGDGIYTKSIVFDASYSDASVKDSSEYYKDDNNIVTLDVALNQLKNEIRETKEGVAWVYKNGTIGGGGGGGSVGNISFKISSPDYEMSNNQIIINNGSNVVLNFSIKGAALGRKMIITIRDKDGNIYDGYKNATYVVSTKSTSITIPNVLSDTFIEFSGYDAETLTMIETTNINIKLANLKIIALDSVQIPSSDDIYQMEYNIITTEGQMTSLSLYTEIAGTTYKYLYPEIIRQSCILSFDIFNVFEDDMGNKLDLKSYINSGLVNFSIIANVSAGDFDFPWETQIAITDPTRITMDITPLNNIPYSIKNNDENNYYVNIDKLEEGVIPSYSYIENNNINFVIKMFFNTLEYTMYYELYQFDDENKPYTLFKQGTLENPADITNRPSDTTYYGYSYQVTIPYSSLKNINKNKPVFIYAKSWDKEYPLLYSGNVTKWFRIADEGAYSPFNDALSGNDTYDNNANYLYYNWNQKEIFNVPGNIWNSDRTFKGTGNEINVKGYIKYYNCNNITNGLLRRNSKYPSNLMRLSSNAYAVTYDSNNKEFCPFANNENNWMFNTEGWTLSFLVKTDIQPDTDNVIISCANFNASDEFSEGIYITTEDVKVRFMDSKGSQGKFSLTGKLAQNTINQIDIVFKPGNQLDTTGELKLYINGVLASAGISKNGYFNKNNTNFTKITSPITFAAKNSKVSNFSKFADVNFYRIMIYKRWLSDFHIVKNYIQGQAEVNLDEKGEIKAEEMNILKRKNFFFDTDGKSLLIKDSSNDYGLNGTHVDDLYNTIVTANEKPLPVLCITLNEQDGSYFESAVAGRYSEDAVNADKNIQNEAEKKFTKKCRCAFEFTPERSNTTFKFGVEVDNPIIDDFNDYPWITLQGTSTMQYLSKNFQIGFGTNKEGKQHLVQFYEDMLPENEYILKADVMDSAHANNAAIGKFINEFLSSSPTYFTNAMNELGGDNEYKNEIKHTTLGHPCLVFIKYNKNKPIPVFHGIYSFNLGRISHFNLGYNKFKGHYSVKSMNDENEYVVKYDNHKVVDTNIKFPAWVSSYDTIPVPYQSGLKNLSKNVSSAICYECVANDNVVGSFQQCSDSIIKNFYSRVYPSIEIENENTKDNALANFKKLFLATSNLYNCDPSNYICDINADLSNEDAQRTGAKYVRDVSGNFKLKDRDIYETFNPDNINNYELIEEWTRLSTFGALTRPQGNDGGEENNAGLAWEYASAYFVLSMLFGLTDSLGKNLNIRSFDQQTWYTSFYDMDTGLGLTNAGAETVKKDVYLDTFTNASTKDQISVLINGYRGGYDTFNSRLWNIIRFLNTRYIAPNESEYPNSNYRSIWEELRMGKLNNPEDFIKNYYIDQNKNVGELLFNFDYYEKYVNDEIEYIKNYDKDDGTPTTTSVRSSIEFLHGNRINYVKDWFTKHVYFLDGVFDLGRVDQSRSEASYELYGRVSTESNSYGQGANGQITSSYPTGTTGGFILSPYNSKNTNDRLEPGQNKTIKFTLKSILPMFFAFSNGISAQRVYIPEGQATDVYLSLRSGSSQTSSFNFEPYISQWDKIGDLCKITFLKSNLTSLTNLDFSNSTSINIDLPGNFDVTSLKELRKINMSNVKNKNTNTKFELNLINSDKINYVDVRNSDVISINFPINDDNTYGGSLETLLIDGTNIEKLDLSNQAMLSTFSASNCPVLRELIFKGNALLKNISSIPDTISRLIIDECKTLENVSLINMKSLVDANVDKSEGFYIGKVPSLKTFVYTASNDKNAKYLTKLDLSGATNLESIQLQGFKGNYITLALSAKKTLTDINFANSSIQYIRWFDTETNQEYYSKVGYSSDTDYSTFSHENVFDFSECKNLQSFNLSKTSVKYIILPEGRTFNIDSAVSNCDNLERIVGNINISSNSLLKSLKKFRFNEVAYYEPSTDQIKNKDYLTTNIILDFETGNFSVNELPETEFNTIIDGNNTYINVKNLVTNFTFNVKDATELCAGSSINISDMYAVLIKLGNSVKSLDKTFENCKNIHAGTAIPGYHNADEKFYVLEYESLLSNMFKFNTNVETLFRTFAGTDINNVITNVLKPLKKITELNETFADTGRLWITSSDFDINNGLENNIKVLKNLFSSRTSGQVELYTFFKSLNNLEDITGLFYGTQVQISTSFHKFTTKTMGEINVIKCFVNNPKLHKVSKWFNTKQIVLSSEYYLDIADIFGGVTRWLHNIGEITDEQLIIDGKYNINDTYPRDLYDLSECFATTTEKESSLILDWKYIDKLFYNISYDSEFNCCLENCSNMFNNIPRIKSSKSSIDESSYSINKDGSDAEFPINIFNVTDKDGNQIYFNKLKNVAGMFRESAFRKTLDFPGNIFKYCRCSEGLDISEFLKNTVIMPINLVSIVTNPEYDCFRHCKITKAAGLFEDCARTLDASLASAALNGNEMYSRFDNGGVRNPIPYKFFYMENSNGIPVNSITALDKAFKNCNWMGCRVSTTQVADLTPRYNNKEMFYTTERPTYDELVAMRGKNISASELKTLVAKNALGVYDWDPWSYDGAVLSDEYTNELTADLISRITENSGKTTSGKSYLETKYETIESYVDYVMDSSNVDFDASLSDILNENSALANAYIGKYEKTTTKDSSILRIYYDADKDPKFVNIDYQVGGGEVNSFTIWGMSANTDGLRYNINENVPTKFVSNYMLPMDLFRYCTPTCTIDNIFEDLSRFNRTDRTNSDKVHFIYGLIGRIPPKLFEPLQNLENMKNVFLGCKGITPYAQSLDGQYYRFMFKNNTSLNSLDFAFSGTMILGSLTDDFIKTNTFLRSLEGTFKNGYMPLQYINNNNVNDYRNFIHPEMFKNNGGLNSTSFMFGKDDQETDDSNMSFDIYDTMLSVVSNPTLINVNGMFYNQKMIPKTPTNKQICPFHTWVTDCMNAYMNTGFNLKEILGNDEEALLKYGITI